jgi:hypothetical protein
LNIFKENNPDIDEDTALRAIIGYYYSTQVLEYNVLNEIRGKYLKIVKTNEVKSQFQDNKGNYYSWVQDILTESPLVSKFNTIITPKLSREPRNPIHYFINTETELPWYIYKRVNNHSDDLEKLNMNPTHFGCLNDFYTEDARKIVDEITHGNAEWVSSIRKKILNMNQEPFDGGKKKINKSLKNRKRKMKKATKRKNKKATKRKNKKI